MSGKPGTTYKLKHTKFTGVNICNITKDKKGVLEINGKDIEGYDRQKLAEYLGKRLPSDRYTYTMFFNSGEVYNGTIRVFNKNLPEKPKDDNQSVLSNILQKLNTINSGDGVSFDTMFTYAKSGYEAQISFLNQQIVFKDGQIVKLNEEILKLNTECDNYETQIIELEKKTGWVGLFNNYRPLIESALLKIGANKNTVPLAGNQNHKGIPNEVLDILAVVDYEALQQQPEQYNQILDYLRQYISVLPSKIKEVN